MAHSLRAAAVAGTLALAALAVRCDPQTFDLLPEYGAGASGKPSTGGKGNSNTGGIFGSAGGGGSAGRASGGKASGGQINGGAPSTFGGSTFVTGGRIGVGTAGFGGKQTTFPDSCSEGCPDNICTPCVPGGPDNGGCRQGLFCPNPNTQLAQSCPVCVACRANTDCPVAPLTRCNSWTRTCSQQCMSDDDCTALPQAKYCALDNNGMGICSECRNENHKLCGAERVCTKHNTCVDCVNNNDCENKDPLHPICDATHGVCVECESSLNDCRNEQRPFCDIVRGTCIECGSNADCQFSQPSAAACVLGVCTCTNNDQCVNSPFGRACVANHCRECVPQQQCPNGGTCDASGNCPH